MKLFFILLFLCQTALGLGVIVDASSNNVPTSFDATAGSAALTCGASYTVEIHNETTTALAIAFQQANKSAPSTDYAYVLAGAGAGAVFTKPDGSFQIGNNTKVYLRSVSGSAITSGTVRVACY